LVVIVLMALIAMAARAQDIGTMIPKSGGAVGHGVHA
jgi:hypothetical protein